MSVLPVGNFPPKPNKEEVWKDYKKRIRSIYGNKYNEYFKFAETFSQSNDLNADEFMHLSPPEQSLIFNFEDLLQAQRDGFNELSLEDQFLFIQNPHEWLNQKREREVQLMVNFIFDKIVKNFKEEE